MEKSKDNFSCPTCSSTFTEKGSLTRHLKNKHPSTNIVSQKTPLGQFNCTSCDKTFTTKGNLTRHSNDKHNAAKKSVNIYCPYCEECFTRKDNLTRHIASKHNGTNTKCSIKTSTENQNFEKDDASTIPCPFCQECFINQDNLTTHIACKHKDNDGTSEECFIKTSTENQHLEKDDASTIPCPFCQECFINQDNLTIHIASKHKDNDGTSRECCEPLFSFETLNADLQENPGPLNNIDDKTQKNHQCNSCWKNFSLKQNLNKHLRNVHQISCQRPPSILCPLCDSAFHTILLLDKHLVNDHKIVLNEANAKFDTIDDFNNWKRAIEQEDLAFFSLKAKAENKMYYECHRSGQCKSSQLSQKFKWKESSKIDKNCTARIVITVADGIFHVYSQRTHLGHSQTIEHLRLRKHERDELANKLKLGVTLNRILDDVRESVASTDSIKRIHIIDKRDLYNILRDYKLDREVVHKNDAFSVEMWVQGQMSLGENSPVAYFKMQGRTDDGSLEQEDFMIVLMTPYQRNIVAKYTTDKVCVDSTHKPTDHDFQLTTVVTVDEFGAGCPVAFCLSNKIDAVAMSQFFEAVKQKVGKIKAKTFMSDDAPAYINAWTDVMSKPEHHLICNWHIDKNWRKNLNKIKNTLKQPEVYKACRMLMECLDIDTFHECMIGFLSMCEEDPETTDFGYYFRRYYAGRPEQWAFCYRTGLSLNTNMFLEALHKKIKYCYMEGRQNKRVDKCIGLLLRVARDMMFERTIRMVKNKPTYRMEQIAQSHNRSKKISDDMIDKVDESTWTVKSSTLGRGPYTVSINSLEDYAECPRNHLDEKACPLSCTKCSVCVHKFTCTCVDFLIKGNFCKHVHACIRYSNIKVGNELLNDTNVNSIELHNDQIVKSVGGKSVHIRDSVTPSTRLKTLAHLLIDMADITSEDIVLKAVSRLESTVELMKQNPINHEAPMLSTPHFPELPSNLPSHQNIEKQIFYSTRKQRVSEVRVKKPTVLEKASMESLTVNPSRRSELISTEFDHNYDSSGKSS